MRIILALEVHVTKALLDVVHNRNNDPSYQGLSENDVDLYNYLKRNHISIIQQLLKKDKVILVENYSCTGSTCYKSTT